MQPATKVTSRSPRRQPHGGCVYTAAQSPTVREDGYVRHVTQDAQGVLKILQELALRIQQALHHLHRHTPTTWATAFQRRRMGARRGSASARILDQSRAAKTLTEQSTGSSCSYTSGRACRPSSTVRTASRQEYAARDSSSSSSSSAPLSLQYVKNVSPCTRHKRVHEGSQETPHSKSQQQQQQQQQRSLAFPDTHQLDDQRKSHRRKLLGESLQNHLQGRHDLRMRTTLPHN